MHAKMSNDNFTGHNFFYLVYRYLVDQSASKTNDIHFTCVEHWDLMCSTHPHSARADHNMQGIMKIFVKHVSNILMQDIAPEVQTRVSKVLPIFYCDRFKYNDLMPE